MHTSRCVEEGSTTALNVQLPKPDLAAFATVSLVSAQVQELGAIYTSLCVEDGSESTGADPGLTVGGCLELSRAH